MSLCPEINVDSSECTTELDANIVEGWLNVWEIDHELENHVFGAGRYPTPRWEPHFCVLTSDASKIEFLKSEQERVEDEKTEVSCGCTRVRLDGGREHFERRWGYKTLAVLREDTQGGGGSPLPGAQEEGKAEGGSTEEKEEVVVVEVVVEDVDEGEKDAAASSDADSDSLEVRVGQLTIPMAKSISYMRC
ncbi:uncharacterized protein LOC101849787 isoform X2 [Aplysia californica]|uniref:Uncharacterized protein LOC101849787 isoform X2 n=1 Tax=Aplysia californica TaxID=6500 RepID=A0ABM1VYA4_APLCA|nr:uncharacterized protein LOC101849787 isoform X2 [Aplysia californica]